MPLNLQLNILSFSCTSILELLFNLLFCAPQVEDRIEATIGRQIEEIDDQMRAWTR
jgi:hypothetical protein